MKQRTIQRCGMPVVLLSPFLAASNSQKINCPLGLRRFNERRSVVACRFVTLAFEAAVSREYFSSSLEAKLSNFSGDAFNSEGAPANLYVYLHSFW